MKNIAELKKQNRIPDEEIFKWVVKRLTVDDYLPKQVEIKDSFFSSGRYSDFIKDMKKAGAVNTVNRRSKLLALNISFNKDGKIAKRQTKKETTA